MRYLLTAIFTLNYLLVLSQSEQDTLCSCFEEKTNRDYTKYCFYSDSHFTFEHRWHLSHSMLSGEYKKDGKFLILNSSYCEEEKTKESFYGSKDSVYIFFSDWPGSIGIYTGKDTIVVFVMDSMIAIPNKPQYQQGILFFHTQKIKKIPIKFNSKEHNSMMIKICQPFQGILRFKNFRVIMKKNMLIVPKTEGVTLRKSILQKVAP